MAAVLTASTMTAATFAKADKSYTETQTNIMQNAKGVLHIGDHNIFGRDRLLFNVDFEMPVFDANGIFKVGC